MAEFQNNQLVEINEIDINDAKYFSGSFDNEVVRKKAFINSLGANVGFKFLASLEINAVNERSLYTCKSILKELEISDLNVGDVRIDTRLVFNEDEIFIPKTQFEYEVTPDLYLIFKVDKNLASAQFLGYITPEEINFENENRDYYFVEKDSLHNSEQLKNVIDEGIVKTPNLTDEKELETAQMLLLNFVDDNILNSDKKLIYKMLLNNSQFYSQLIELENFEVLSTQLVNNEEIFKGSILDTSDFQDLSDITEADKVDLEELAESTVDDFVEEYKGIEQAKKEEPEEERIVPSLFEDNEDEQIEELPAESVISEIKESDTDNENEDEDDDDDDDDDEIVLKPQIEEAIPKNIKIDDLEPLNSPEENAFDLIENDTAMEELKEQLEEDLETNSSDTGAETEAPTIKEETISTNEFEIPNVDLEGITFKDEPIIKEVPPEKIHSEASEIKELYEQIKPNDRPSEKIQTTLEENVYKKIKPAKKSVCFKALIFTLLILILLSILLYFAYKQWNYQIPHLSESNILKTPFSKYRQKIKNIEIFNKEKTILAPQVSIPAYEKAIEPKQQANTSFIQYKNPNQRIKKIEWEVPQELINSFEVTNYLQTVGKTLKISLQNDLLTIPSSAELDNMVLNIRLNEKGNLKGIKTVVSSGMPKADAIVLQSVKAAIQYVKPLSEELKSSYSDLTLIINF